MYEIEPVSVEGGCFHPKILLLANKDDVHLVVGSGNLTFSGWGRNLECFEHLHPSFAADVGIMVQIHSMPWPIRWLTCVLLPRYFVASLQTLFLAGDVMSVLVPNTLLLGCAAIALFALLVRSTRMRLE